MTCQVSHNIQDRYILEVALTEQICCGSTSVQECLREHFQSKDDLSQRQKEARKWRTCTEESPEA